MTPNDENVENLLLAAKRVVAHNNGLRFSMENVTKTALKVADGDVQRAQDLLLSMAEFSLAAILMLQERHHRSSVECAPFSAIQKRSKLRASNDQTVELRDLLLSRDQGAGKPDGAERTE